MAAKKRGEKPTWQQIVIDLGIQEHLDIMAANDLRVDAQHIDDPEYPSVQIVTGVLFRTLVNREVAFLVLASRYAEDINGVYEGRRGDPLLDFPLEVVAAWSRSDGTQAVFIDEENRTLVEMATPLAVYNGDGCTIPEHPIDSVVFWKYRNGRRTMGLALPYDLDKAEAEGWFLRAAALVGIRTTVQLYPALSRLRNRAGRVEPQGIHLSGLRIVSPFPAIGGWGQPVEALLTQRGRVLIAVPMPSVGTVEAADAIEEVAAQSTELEISDGVEIGPEEVRMGRGDIRSIWDVLANAHATRGMEFEPITRDSSHAHIRAAHRAVASAIHPDRLQGRLGKIPNLPKEVVNNAIKQAALQWAPLDEAFRKALAMRDGELELVKMSLDSLDLDGDALAAARKAREGTDELGKLVASALGVSSFDWFNENHVGLRQRAIDILRARAKAAAKVTEPDDETSADSLPDEAPATT